MVVNLSLIVSTFTVHTSIFIMKLISSDHSSSQTNKQTKIKSEPSSSFWSNIRSDRNDQATVVVQLHHSDNDDDDGDVDIDHDHDDE